MVCGCNVLQWEKTVSFGLKKYCLLVQNTKIFCHFQYVVNRFERLSRNQELHQTKMMFNLIEECNIYKHDGRRERGHDIIERQGYNFRITELKAAVGVAQLNMSKCKTVCCWQIIKSKMVLKNSIIQLSKKSSN